MGIFDKMLDVMKLDDDDDEYYDDELVDEDAEPEEPAPAPRKSVFSRKHRTEELPMEEEPKNIKPVPQKVTPVHAHRSTTASGMEVCVIKPSVFEDSKEVVDTILTNRPVILNMEGLDLNLAQRIIDVTSGACLALDGKLQKVSNYIFIVSPSSVDISGDLQGIVDQFDMSGIQTGF